MHQSPLLYPGLFNDKEVLSCIGGPTLKLHIQVLNYHGPKPISKNQSMCISNCYWPMEMEEEAGISKEIQGKISSQFVLHSVILLRNKSQHGRTAG